MRTSNLLLVLATFVWTPLEAQPSYPPLSEILTESGLFRIPGGTSNYGRTLVGNFNEGLTRDFVVLDGDQSVLLLNPQIHVSRMTYPSAPGTVSDIAVLSADPVDGLLTAGSGGLEAWVLEQGQLTPMSVKDAGRSRARHIAWHTAGGELHPALKTYCMSC